MRRLNHSRRDGQSGQAIVEAAFAFTLMVLLLTSVVSVGQFIGYGDGLANAAAAAASAAATQIDEGASSSTAASAAATAINQEQNVSTWGVCTSSDTPPCVAVSSATQSTGSSTTVKVETATLYGSYSPLFNVLGLSFPITVSASSV